MIEVQQIAVRAGDFRLEQISFAVPSGAYAVLMGRTGSGKTTLLEALCGLKEIVAGRVLLAGRDVTRLGPAERQIGYVPQDGALFPTMSVREHLAFPLWLRNWSEAAIDARVAELARSLELAHLLERHPYNLSGGERQRTALARALAFRPAILCLDEPLSALDDVMRHEMIELLRRVQRETGVTALHVTHNRAEAEQLADLLLVIEQGQVEIVRQRDPLRETLC